MNIRIRAGLRGLIASSVLILVGCEVSHYRVSMEETERGVRRRITGWVEEEGKKSPLPEDELRNLARWYRAAAEQGEGPERTFTGEFEEHLPRDLKWGASTSYGTCIELSARLGTVVMYAERLPGREAPAASLQKSFRSGDELTDILAGWFRAEMGKGPDADKLEAFFRNELRWDLYNLAALGWLLGTARDEKAAEETTARALLYLERRGYVRKKDLGTFSRAMRNERDSIPAVMRWVRGVIARKLGRESEKDLPASLAFLNDAKSAGASLIKHLEASEAGKRLRTRVRARAVREEARRTGAPPADGKEFGGSDYVSAMGELTLDALSLEFDLGAATSDVTIRFAASSAPLKTNGKWDEKAGRVVWEMAGLGRDEKLPPICYALWAQPNHELQKARFGRVVLAGDALAQYVYWRNGLDEGEAKKWDALLDSLRPGEGLTERIRAFRFSGGQPTGEGAPPDLSDKPRELILKALERPPPDQM